MLFKKYLFIGLISCLCLGCNNGETSQSQENPAAEGFNIEASDPRAIRIADSVMKAMGGREAYDELRFIAWNFFGSRDLVWDKHTGRVRIEIPAEDIIYLLDIDSMEGKAMVQNREITNSDSLATHLDRAKKIWINDSYWLVMPFKLKDTGVTLKYVREDTTAKGIPADVLSLTFENVGATPQNKYEIYVDKQDKLVRQWAYFEKASQDKPTAVWPWDNYVSYNGVLLSSDRSDGKGPRNVRVYNELNDDVFTSFTKPSLVMQ